MYIHVYTPTYTYAQKIKLKILDRLVIEPRSNILLSKGLTDTHHKILHKK